MHYLALLFGTEGGPDSEPGTPEFDADVELYAAFEEAAGHAIAGGVALYPSTEGRLIRHTADGPLVSDGVLVVDGGASLRYALVGGNLAAAAARNGWAGLLVDGCVRDVAELNATPIGIRALALMPLPTEKRNQGQRDVAVCIQGVWVRPGDWLYADADGIVVSAQPLL